MHSLGNLFEHNFCRATANGVDARIPRHAFNGALSHESHSAMELQTGVHDFFDEFTAVSLHHRTLLACVTSLLGEPGRVENQLPPSLDFGGKHRQAVAD